VLLDELGEARGLRWGRGGGLGLQERLVGAALLSELEAAAQPEAAGAAAIALVALLLWFRYYFVSS
jgi:hypothetical protein